MGSKSNGEKRQEGSLILKQILKYNTDKMTWIVLEETMLVDLFEITHPVRPGDVDGAGARVNIAALRRNRQRRVDVTACE